MRHHEPNLLDRRVRLDKTHESTGEIAHTSGRKHTTNRPLRGSSHHRRQRLSRLFDRAHKVHRSHSSKSHSTRLFKDRSRRLLETSWTEFEQN